MLVSIFPSIPFLVAAALLFFMLLINMEEEIEQDLKKKKLKAMPENSIDHIDFEDLNKKSISPHYYSPLYC